MGAHQRRARADRRLKAARLPRPGRAALAFRRATRRACAGFVLALVVGLPAGPGAEPLALRAKPLPFAAENAPATIGALRFAGALAVTSRDRRFGGLSAMLIDADFRLTGLSDVGLWISARLVMEGDRLVGIRDLDLQALQDGAGQPLPRGWMADAESLARLPDGRLVVGFERWHRLRAYARPGAAAEYFPAPPGVELLRANEGLEALASLADGRLLALEEGLDDGTPRHAWLYDRGSWTRFFYTVPPGMRPSDATGLPDGGALVLERQFSFFSGFASRVVHLPAAALAAVREGSTVTPSQLAYIAPPLLSDNFEAIAAVPRAAGGLFVFIASDDNFNSLQRTLILAFVLEGLAP